MEIDSRHPQLPQGYQLKTFIGVDDPNLLAEITRFRLAVWRAESTTLVGSFPDNSWGDEKDLLSQHLVVFSLSCPDKIIASARLTLYDSFESFPDRAWYSDFALPVVPPIAYLTRDVVDSQHRTIGLGQYLNLERLRLAEDQGAKTAIADIPDYRIRSFEALGFAMMQKPKIGIIFPEMKWTVMLKYLASSITNV